MTISLIAAMANDRVIGKDQAMPWDLPEDLKHFKDTTMNKPIIMGRKTYDSIGRALPGRRNIVVSRQQLEIAQVEVVQSLQAALDLCLDAEEIIIMGGGQLYKQALPMADRLYLTHIEISVEGDTQFPKWDDGSWNMVSESAHVSKKGLAHRFCTYERSSS